jgi:hypothetical protein
MIKEMTSDYIDYHISGLNLPTIRFTKVKKEIEMKLSFKPVIN